MAAPGRARQPQQARTAARTGGKRDKGTRGGRPEPVTPQPRLAKPKPQRPPAGRAEPAPAEAPAALPRGPKGWAVGGWRWVRRNPLPFFTGLLSLAGLGVSIYLTIDHYTGAAPICTESGIVNCTKVTTSPESNVFGIPVAVLGLAFYLFMVAANSPRAWRSTWPALRWARLVSVIVGMVFVLYLIYTELFTLNAICLWCTSVHVITFLLFGLIVFATTAGYGKQDPKPV